MSKDILLVGGTHHGDYVSSTELPAEYYVIKSVDGRPYGVYYPLVVEIPND